MQFPLVDETVAKPTTWYTLISWRPTIVSVAASMVRCTTTQKQTFRPSNQKDNGTWVETIHANSGAGRTAYCRTAASQ